MYAHGFEHRLASVKSVVIATVALLAVAGSTASADTVNWIGGTGDWEDAFNWDSDPALPGMTDDVVIDLGMTGLWVELWNSNAHVNSLYLNENLSLANNEFRINTTAVIDGLLSTQSSTLRGGTWSVGSGGEMRLDNTTLLDLTFNGNVNWGYDESRNVSLDNVVMNGDIDLGTELRLFNGLDHNGTLHLTNAGQVSIWGTQTYSNGDIRIDGIDNDVRRLSLRDGSVLTLAAGTTLTGGGLEIVRGSAGSNAIGLTNYGAITADVDGETIFIEEAEVLNFGTIDAMSGGRLVIENMSGDLNTASVDGAGSLLDLDGMYTINNSLAVTNGGTLTLRGSWTNTGGVSATDSTVNLGGTFTSADMTAITRTNSDLNIVGTLDNVGSSVSFNNSADPIGLDGGTISGGTLTTSSDGFIISSSSQNSLDGVTLNGTLSLSNALLNFDGAWHNAGTINAVDSFLNLHGTFSTADLGAMTSTNGEINIRGTMDNSGATFTLTPALIELGLDGGTIVGGTISPTTMEALLVRDAPSDAFSTLDGVTVNAPIDLQGKLAIQTGTALNGGVSGNGELRYFANQTISSGTFDLQGRLSAEATSDPADPVTITFGPGATINPVGTLTIGSRSHEPNDETFINNTGITIDNAVLKVEPETFTNSGSMTLVSGSLEIGRDPGFAVTEWSNSGTINVQGGTLRLGGEFTTSGIGTINRSGGDVVVNGVLDNSSDTLALDTSTGSWIVDGSGSASSLNNGRIEGGVVSTSGGAAIDLRNYGELNGVTLNGTALVDRAAIRNGLTLNGLADFQFPNAQLAVVDTQTIDGTGTLKLSGATSGYRYLNLEQNTILTLASGVTLEGGLSFVGADSLTPELGTEIINNARIVSNQSGETMSIVPRTFTNHGTLEVTNNALMDIGFAGGGGSWSSDGTIRAISGTINLLGDMNLGGTTWDIAPSATVNLKGTLNNTGQTLALNASTGSWIVDQGQVSGGTVDLTSGQTLNFNHRIQNRLDGATVLGTLDLGTTDAVFSTSGFSLGSGATVALSGAGSTIRFDQTGSVSGGEIVASGTGTARLIDVRENTILTIDSGTTIRGGNMAIGSIHTTATASEIINDGEITADATGQELAIESNIFTNNGTLRTTNGAHLRVGGERNISGTDYVTSWTNQGTIDINGGTFEMAGILTQSGGTFEINSGAAILSGGIQNAGSSIAVNGSSTALDLHGGTITGGSLDLLNGGSLAFSQAGSGIDGTLDGVTVNGALNIDDPDATLFVSGNTTFSNTVTLSASGSEIMLPSGFSLANTEIVFDGTTLGDTRNLRTDGGTVLGSNTIVRGGRGTITRVNSNIPTLTNEGLVSADRAGERLTISGLDFTNNGTMEAKNGGILDIRGEPWVNNGTISVQDGSRLELGGSFGMMDVGTITRTGQNTVALTGSLDLFFLPFDLDAEIGDMVVDGGTLHTGRIKTASPDSLAFTSNPNNELTSARVEGGFSLPDTGSYINIGGDLDVDGTVKVTGAGSTIRFLNNSSFEKGTVEFDATSGADSKFVAIGQGPARTVTIENGTTIRGGRAQIGELFDEGSLSQVVNQGLISADRSGEIIKIAAENFTNEGTIEAINGGSIEYIQSGEEDSSLRGLVGTGLVNSGELRIRSDASFKGTGNYAQTADGILSMQIDALLAQGRPYFTITGDTTLDGTLELTQATSFNPHLDYLFNIITAQSVIGLFDTVETTGFEDWDVSLRYHPSRVELSLTALLDGNTGTHTIPDISDRLDRSGQHHSQSNVPAPGSTVLVVTSGLILIRRSRASSTDRCLCRVI